MTRIGLLSDTHAFWDERYAQHFADVDQIWHAGDIGSMEVARKLAEICPLKAVHGNIDGGDMRRMFPETLRFRCEDVDVLLKHIGGYPGHYDRSIIASLQTRPPKLFISGHSHILKVQYDPHFQLLHVNPGAAGIQGWQRVRTLVRFVIDGTNIRDLEVIELSQPAPDFL
ncbi:MAG: metallophosphoesterase family protein [Bacteroidaceae bacterium]|nr:metallophosphoesterase family protein [Bacteroidaceae bacterium]